MAMTHQGADETLNDALTGAATPHVWVHTGDPGAAGTANVAQIDTSNVARKATTFAAPGNHPTNTERRSLSTPEPEWTGEQIDAAQDLTHFSVWSADLEPGTYLLEVKAKLDDVVWTAREELVQVLASKIKEAVVDA